jgi:hypothetical protein
MYIYIAFQTYSGNNPGPHVVAVFTTFEKAQHELIDGLPVGANPSSWNHMVTDMRDVETWEADCTVSSGPSRLHIHKYPLDEYSLDLAGIGHSTPNNRKS